MATSPQTVTSPDEDSFLMSANDIPRKRVRKPMSCDPCRQRKLRCNRALPACDTCIRREVVADCSYQSRKSAAQKKNTPPQQLSGSLQTRMDRLEGLVLSMMTASQTQSPHSSRDQHAESASESLISGPSAQDPYSSVFRSKAHGQPISGVTQIQQHRKPADVMNIEADYKKPSTIDQSHWSALLAEIWGVREHLHSQKEQYEQHLRKITTLATRSLEDPAPTLLFGSSTTLYRDGILSQIPSKYICDLMIRQYFKVLDPALYILHKPSFEKQYAEHWRTPNHTSIVWIGLMFAMMRIVALSWLKRDDEPQEFKGKCRDLAFSYRTHVADCLILADYTLPHDFLIETLALHFYGEYAAQKDAKSSCWVLLGMIIRLAMRMSYHRDPRHHPEITPFNGEMRRRVWAFISQADILFSFQAGLPSMIKSLRVEVDLPRNINENGQFHEGCTELPESLSINQVTPISYLISKTKLAFKFSRALEEASNSGENSPYENILDIDRGLREAYDSIPEFYKLRSMAEQAADPVHLIAARFTLASIHHKSLCVVHSRFLGKARVNQRYLYSRRYQEALVGGESQLLQRYQTSLTTHDFLLAATIVCAELQLDQEHRNGAQQLLNGPFRHQLIDALDRSAEIWSRQRDQSMEAYKASDILGMLLDKFRSQDKQQSEQDGTRRRRPPQTTPQRTSLEALTRPEQQLNEFDLLNQIGHSDQQPLNLDHMFDAPMSGLHDSLLDTYRTLPNILPSSMSQNTSDRLNEPWGPWATGSSTLDFSDPMSFLRSF